MSDLPTFTSARDEIAGLFLAHWRAHAPAVNRGRDVQVFWHGVDAGHAPPAGLPWARFVLRHREGTQATFGASGQRRFARDGLVSVQVFAPLSAGGVALAELLAVVARGAFEGVGTASGIWFRNARIHEAGVDGAWVQMNVLADFVYDEMR